MISLLQLAALLPHQALQFIEQLAIFLAHNLHEAREQWRRATGTMRQQRINQVGGNSLLKLFAGDARRIEKGPALFAAIEYAPADPA